MLQERCRPLAQSGVIEAPRVQLENGLLRTKQKPTSLPTLHDNTRSRGAAKKFHTRRVGTTGEQLEKYNLAHAAIQDSFLPDQPDKAEPEGERKTRKPAFRLINPTATPFERETAPRPGHFTKLAAASNRPFGKICGRRGGGEGGCAPCRRPGSPTGTRRAVTPLRRPEAAGCRAPNRSLAGPRPEALFLEESLFFNSVRRYPASGWRAFRMNRSNSSQDPVRKAGRDRGLNPLEPGFSHELPDNDTDNTRAEGKPSLPGVALTSQKKGVFQLICYLGRVKLLISSDERGIC